MNMKISMKKVKRIAILATAVGYFALSKYCEKVGKNKANFIETPSEDINNDEKNCDCFVKIPSSEENI